MSKAISGLLRSRARENEDWDFCRPKGDNLWLWAIVGIFITLWGVSELLGDIYWWASTGFLWGVFLLVVGSTIVVKVLRARVRGESMGFTDWIAHAGDVEMPCHWMMKKMMDDG